jgi:uncharacterized membrane protein
MLATMLTNLPPLLASAAASQPAASHADAPPLVHDPAGVLAVLLAVLAGIFWMTQHPTLGKIFKVVPALIFCYFVPTLLTTFNIIPNDSELYSWIKSYVLPASLLLLILSLDVPGILRLGPKAVIMLLAGTTGVVIGGPISLWICKDFLPPDIWQGMTALCGSWIGGGANFVALGKMADASDQMIAAMVIPDVFVANCWMAVLLYCAASQRTIDRWTGANASAIRDLEQRLTDFQQRVGRKPTLADLLIILAFGFGGAYLSYVAGHGIVDTGVGVWLNEKLAISATVWKYVLVTSVAVVLSFTPARNLEGAGASKVGSVMLYLLVACIGAHANFRDLSEQPAYILMAGIWISIHVIVLLTTAWIIRAPIFFVAVGSQANIGGAASAPIVAAAFHPSLAPVGVLLAVAGYVLGTYAGWICMLLLKFVAGVGG